MMYSQKLAAAIKVNGKVLREFKDTVYIPFGAEYTILVKNLNTTRAVVNIFLDGENVVPGGLVINPGQDIDLERWIKNGNLSEGNRFKFIERTENIENGPRGIKLEDGLIRIEHQFEQPRPVWTNNLMRGFSTSAISGSTGDWQGAGSAIYSSTSASLNNMTVSAQSFSDVGITVPGSRSDQKFSEVTMGLMESATHSMVIKLLGDLGDNKPVTKPVTVAHKPKCVTCGKQNKAHAKYCVECGTALEIFA